MSEPFLKIIAPKTIYVDVSKYDQNGNPVPGLADEVTVRVNWHTYSNVPLIKLNPKPDPLNPKPSDYGKIIRTNIPLPTKLTSGNFTGQQSWWVDYKYKPRNKIRESLTLEAGILKSDNLEDIQQCEVELEYALEARRKVDGNILHLNLSGRSTDYPYALLPLRIETRWVTGANDKLQIRVYPDDIMIHDHREKPSEAEHRALGRYKDITDEAKRLAFQRDMVRKFGAERTALLLKNVDNNNFKPLTETDDLKEEKSKVARWMLPRLFWSILFDMRTQKIVEKWPFECSVNTELRKGVKITGKGLPLWMTNFDVAVDMGMATKAIKPPAGERFRLIVIGDYADDSNGTWGHSDGTSGLRQLFEGHRYSKGLAFVPCGTPTNNTQQSRSGYSADNKLGQYNNELEEFENGIWKALLEKDPNHPMAAKILGDAFLGLYDDLEVFRNVEGATDRAPSVVREMKVILWWAIVKPFLKDQLGLSDDLDKNTIASIKNHYLEFLSPEGPLPAIRVGNQPYGILPVTNITSGTVGAEGSKPFDVALSNLLTVLYDQWLNVANNPMAVPQLGSELDPSVMFLETLRMQPVSVEGSYKLRPLLQNKSSNNKLPVEEILDAVRDYAYIDPLKKSSPYADLKAWADQNKSAQEILSQHIASWGGSSKEALSSLYPWLEDAPLTSLFSPKGPKDDIDNYNKDNGSRSLFSQILLKAQTYSGGSDEFKDAIKFLKDYEIRLTSYEILIPLNTASNANQIVSAFQQKRRTLQKQPSALGITNQIAADILTKRNSLPGKKFTSIDELYTVPGLNAQKLEDLASNLYLAKNLYKPDKQKPTFFNEYRQDIVPELSRIFRATLDTLSHRLDAWITSIAWQRLKAIRKNKSTGIYLGAYGWIDVMQRPPSDEASSFQNVFIHAPSRGQAAAAAVMYNAYLTEPQVANEHPFRLNLHSERSAKSLFLAEGVRQGQPLGALLGYQFERSLHENGLDKYIDDFRDAFPTYTGPNDDPNAESVAARNVVDGLALAQWAMKEPGQIPKEINVALEDIARIKIELAQLTDGMDSVADLLAYENIYHNAQGNYERAGAVNDAAAGRAAPPEIQAIRTPWQGTQLGHRVCMLFPSPEPDKNYDYPLTSPRTVAEPCIAAWAEQILGSAQYISCQFTATNPPTVNPQIISLSAVGLTPMDLIYLSEPSQANGIAELEQIIRHTLRQKFPLGSISIDFKYKHPIPASTQKALSIEEALLMAKQIRQLIGTCTWLRPDSLSLRSPGAVGVIDLGALETRYAVLLTDVTNLENQIKSRIRVLNGTELTKLQHLLHCASRYGIMANRQEWLITPNFPFSQSVSNILKELTKRRTECKAEKDKISPDASPIVQAEAYIQAIKALFGNSIAVLPPFKFNLESKPESLDPNTIWAADKLLSPSTATAGQIRGWLQQSALLYKPLQELEDTMMYAEALNKKPHGGLKLRATQLPFSNANEPWLALQAGKEQKNRFGRVSITTVLTDNLTANTQLAGLLLHQWEEFLPADSLTTAAAFRYNAPSTQPPQSILLAVPGQTGNKNWLVEDLAHMVNDTLNLAKVRAVDAEALQKRPSSAINFFNPVPIVEKELSLEIFNVEKLEISDFNNITEVRKNANEIALFVNYNKQVTIYDLPINNPSGVYFSKVTYDKDPVRIVEKTVRILENGIPVTRTCLLLNIWNDPMVKFEKKHGEIVKMCRISISPYYNYGFGSQDNDNEYYLSKIQNNLKIKIKDTKNNRIQTITKKIEISNLSINHMALDKTIPIIWVWLEASDINSITLEFIADSEVTDGTRALIFGVDYLKKMS